MQDTNSNAVKTAMEIGSLSVQLLPQYQAFVLNTINTFLFAQQCDEQSTLKQKSSKKIG